MSFADNWDPSNLVVWKGAKLLSRPDLEVRRLKGIKTPQRVGRGEFSIEANGEIRRIDVGSSHWDIAISQFAEIKGDIVDVTFLPYPWTFGGCSGTKFFFYQIKESNG